MVRAWRRVRLVVVGLCLLAVPPRSVAAQEVVEYYALDALGSVRVVLDASGNVIGRMDYDPFGAPLAPGVNLSARAYAGLFRDGEAGLDFAQARSYQGRTGRFSTVDPLYAGLFQPQGWNRYAYANNSPLNNVDPTGLQFRSKSNPGCTTFPESCTGDIGTNGRGVPGRNGGGGGNGNDDELADDPDDPIDDGDTGGGDFPNPIPPTPPVPPAPNPSGCDPVTRAGCDAPIVITVVENFGRGMRDSFLTLLSKNGPPSCWTYVAREFVSNMVPHVPSAATAAEQAAIGYAYVEHNRALAYAASRRNAWGGLGLIKPQSSKPFMKIMASRNYWLKISLPLSVVAAEAQALQATWVAGTSGQCR